MAAFNNIVGANGAIPDRGFSTESKLRIQAAQFGDGYAQRWTDGINNELKNIPLSFTNRSKTEITNIVNFLRSYGGFQAFDWLPPGDATAIYVVCKEWSEEYVTPTISSLTLTFEQVKDPTLKPVLTLVPG